MVALQLAREPGMDPSVGGFWKAANVKAGGDTRKRIVGYRDRMLSEGILAAAQQATSLSAAPQSSVMAFGLEVHLFVQRSWIDEHVPLLSDIVAEPLVLSPGRRHATRAISARREQSAEQSLHGTVVYDLPPTCSQSRACIRLGGRQCSGERL